MAYLQSFSLPIPPSKHLSLFHCLSRIRVLISLCVTVHPDLSFSLLCLCGLHASPGLPHLMQELTGAEGWEERDAEETMGTQKSNFYLKLRGWEEKVV